MDLPFSSAVQVDNWLYVSGQLGLKDGKLAEGIATQTEYTLINIQNILKVHILFLILDF